MAKRTLIYCYLIGIAVLFTAWVAINAHKEIVATHLRNSPVSSDISHSPSTYSQKINKAGHDWSNSQQREATTKLSTGNKNNMKPGGRALDYFDRRHFDIKRDFISRGDIDLFHHNRMPVKKYTQTDVVKCLDRLSSEGGRTHRPLHFAFVGDSTIRQHFLSFLRWIPDYDRMTIKTSNSSVFTDYHFHDDRYVTSTLLNSLRVSFYWRELIREHIIDDFKRWTTSTSNSDGNNITSADFILLGLTAHHVGTNDVTHNLGTFVSLLEDKLMPLIKKSLVAHPEQKIVWLHQSRTVLEMTPDFYDIYPDDIDKYNNEIRRVLRGTGVTVWDSVNTIVEENVRACLLTAFERSDRKMYLSCYDFIHPGLRAVSLGSQLIFNHLC